MSKKYVVVEQEDRSSWWIILVAAFLVAYAKFMLTLAIIITVAIAITWLVPQYIKWRKSRLEVKKVVEINALMDAPTKLITEGMSVWGDPEHYLDDFDDGLRSWV